MFVRANVSIEQYGDYFSMDYGAAALIRNTGYQLNYKNANMYLNVNINMSTNEGNDEGIRGRSRNSNSYRMGIEEGNESK